MISESAKFGVNGCSGTGTEGTDTVYDTTLGSAAWLGATTVNFKVNSDGNVF